MTWYIHGLILNVPHRQEQVFLKALGGIEEYGGVNGFAKYKLIIATCCFTGNHVEQ